MARAAVGRVPGRRLGRPRGTRLTELHLSAREEQVDLELAAGRHAEVIADLEALTAQHPLRERLHSRLMLALYRAGRQGDAWPPTSEHGTCSTPNWASLRAPN